jgi:hypothetical protein
MAQQSTIGKTATTIATDAEGIMRVTYHSTPVVTIYPSGRIDLDTGGWFTPTTKTRMNQASNQFGLRFYVYQKDSRWYVDVDGRTINWQESAVYHRGHRGGERLTIRNGS